MVTETEVVPCPPVMDHPVPETLQLYEDAPSTSSMLNVLFVELAHLIEG